MCVSPWDYVPVCLCLCTFPYTSFTLRIGYNSNFLLVFSSVTLFFHVKGFRWRAEVLSVCPKDPSVMPRTGKLFDKGRSADTAPSTPSPPPPLPSSARHWEFDHVGITSILKKQIIFDEYIYKKSEDKFTDSQRVLSKVVIQIID